TFQACSFSHSDTSPNFGYCACSATGRNYSVAPGRGQPKSSHYQSSGYFCSIVRLTPPFFHVSPSQGYVFWLCLLQYRYSAHRRRNSVPAHLKEKLIMSAQLSAILQDPELSQHLLSEYQTRGFVTAMAAAPHLLDPAEWLAYLWGGDETSPFTSHQELENYANAIVQIWNEARQALLSNSWEWPEGCELDDKELITPATREFAEGVLQGWQLARDDWETIMPENSQDNA